MFVSHYRYFRRKLTGNEQKIAVAIEKALFHKEKKVIIPRYDDSITIDLIGDIYTFVYNDNPSFFYVNPTLRSYIIYNSNIELHFNYLYTDQQIAKYENTIASIIRNFSHKNIKTGMSAYEREEAIHDFLVSTITYNHEAINIGLENAARENFNVVGALVQQNAVCWGIACAFKLLCDCFDLHCIVVTGNSVLDDQIGNGHAWNIVELNNKFYHVDVTWDLKVKGREKRIYDYFNVDDKELSRNHSWDGALYPKCIWHDDNYYYKNSCFINRLEQVKPFFLLKLHKNQFEVIMKIRGTMPDDKLIMEQISEAMKEYRSENRRTSRQRMGYRYSSNRTIKNVYVEFYLL